MGLTRREWVFSFLVGALLLGACAAGQPASDPSASFPPIPGPVLGDGRSAASVSPQGGNVRELVLSPERFGAGPLRLVVTVLTLPDQAQTWPVVKDDSASLAVQQGALPDGAQFNPGAWLEVAR